MTGELQNPCHCVQFDTDMLAAASHSQAGCFGGTVLMLLMNLFRTNHYRNVKEASRSFLFS